MSWDAFLPADEPAPPRAATTTEDRGEAKTAEAAAHAREHHCHARRCEARCPPEYLMCFRHWKMVPAELQAAVWKHYRAGQCDDMRPSAAWHEAATAAIAAVYVKEHPRFAAAERAAAGLATDPALAPARATPSPPPQVELALDQADADAAATDGDPQCRSPPVEPSEPSESALATGYATPPEKKPSKSELKNAWMGQAVRRHDKERIRMYCEAMALVLHKLKERRADLLTEHARAARPEAGARLAENEYMAGWIVELGIVRSEDHFEDECRRLGVDPSMFLRHLPPS